jgi:hypothetical protein
MSTTRLRGEGIRVSKDRLIFSRFGHLVSSGSANPYNFDIGDGSLVTEGDVTISGDLTVNSPGVLKELSAAGYNIAQVVRIANTAVSGYTPFHAAADGLIIRLSSVYHVAEGDAADQLFVWLSDGAGLRGESGLVVGPNPGGIAVGEVDTQLIVGGPSNPRDNALRVVARGDLRWLEHFGIGLTAGSDCTIVIEINPAVES